MNENELREFIKNNLRIKINTERENRQNRLTVKLILKDSDTGSEFEIDSDYIVLDEPNDDLIYVPIS